MKSYKILIYFIFISIIINISCSSNIKESNDITDEQIRNALNESLKYDMDGRIDEAIKILLPLAEKAGDRLVTIKPGAKQMSVYNGLGAAYWRKKDYINTLKYLEPVAARIPPDENNAILDVVRTCRKKLLATDKNELVKPIAEINGSYVLLLETNKTYYVSAKRLNQVIGGKFNKSLLTKNWTYKYDGKTIKLYMTDNKQNIYSNKRLLNIYYNNKELMVPLKQLMNEIGAKVIWDLSQKLIKIDVPLKKA